MSETDDEITSVTGPVEKRDGQLVLRIPWDVGGEQLAHCARRISSVADDHLQVRIPDWLAEKLGIAEQETQWPGMLSVSDAIDSREWFVATTNACFNILCATPPRVSECAG